MLILHHSKVIPFILKNNLKTNLWKTIFCLSLFNNSFSSTFSSVFFSPLIYTSTLILSYVNPGKNSVKTGDFSGLRSSINFLSI